MERQKLVKVAEVLKVKYNRKSADKLKEDVDKVLAEVNEKALPLGKAQVKKAEPKRSYAPGPKKGAMYLGKCPRTGKKLYK